MVERVTIQPGYLSLTTAAEWAGVSQRTIKRWVKKGLPTYQAGPREKVLVRPTDIDVFLNRQQAQVPDLDAMVEDVVKTLSADPAFSS